MKAAVVILNWNTSDFLKRFVPGVAQSCAAASSRLYVADSGSTDGSLKFLASCAPEVGVLPLGGNFGFAGGYDRALDRIREDCPEYYVLLNSDIEVSPDWLTHLLDWMDSHPECGICGPKLHSYAQRDRFEYAGAAGGYVDRFGYPYCRGRVLKRTETDNGQYDSPKDVLWVTGACLMIRRPLWETLGGLDDRFFAHMEEIDLCWRASLLGWKVTVVPDSVVWHIGGGTLPASSPLKLKLNYRNSLLMLSRNLEPTFAARGCRFPGFKASVTIRVRLLLDAGSWLVYMLVGQSASARAVSEAHREFRSLRRGQSPSESSGGLVPGFTGLLILPLALLKGGSIFTYLAQYENRH